MLYATPIPMRFESVASWFQRICQRHGCSIGRLGKHLGIPAHLDLDLDLKEKHWRNIVAETGIGRSAVCQGKFVVEGVSTSASKREIQELKGRKWRWCAVCLAQDREPHFRRHWRFGADRCTTHKRVLASACPHCGHSPTFNMTWHLRSLSMGHCPQCQGWLGQFLSSAPLNLEDVLDAREKHLREHRESFGPRVEAIKAGRPLEDGSPSDWLKSGSGRQLPRPLFADADDKLIWGPSERSRPKWSTLLPRGCRGRVVLAGALVLLRSERNEWRAAARAAAGDSNAAGSR